MDFLKNLACVYDTNDAFICGVTCDTAAARTDWSEDLGDQWGNDLTSPSVAGLSFSLTKIWNIQSLSLLPHLADMHGPSDTVSYSTFLGSEHSIGNWKMLHLGKGGDSMVGKNNLLLLLVTYLQILTQRRVEWVVNYRRVWEVVLAVNGESKWPSRLLNVPHRFQSSAAILLKLFPMGVVLSVCSRAVPFIWLAVVLGARFGLQ